MQRPGPSDQLPLEPVVEYVLKVASRCNLSCDHCYVYADPEQSWLHRPVVMDSATVRAAALRIREHAEVHRQERVAVILHGGEPLLVRAAELRRILQELRTVVAPVVELDLHLQSNGTLLTAELCDILADCDVKVGVSLDGDGPANDRHRRFAGGTGSHQQVLRALRLLRTPPYRAIYGGVLCTIDVRNDPIRVYEALLREAPPRIDFLLPHATWDQPPARPAMLPTAYADWLLAIYDRWTADGCVVSIRTFDALLGRGRGSEALGRERGSVVVIETDGTWEQVDSLKAVSGDAPRTGLDVWRHSVNEVASRVGQLEGRTGELPSACRPCPVVDTCGGGLVAHRFGRGNGFANPSVYCADLKHLIGTVRDRRRRNGRARPVALTREREPRPPVLFRLRSGPPDVVVRELAGGYPSDATLEYVTGAEYAVDRVVLSRVAARADCGIGRSAWELLGALDTQKPATLRRVLSHPFVRARARYCLTATTPAGSESPAGLLAAVAATAAVRADAEVLVEVPLWDGMLALPGLGTLALPGAQSAVVAARRDEFVVRPDQGPARMVSADGALATGWRAVGALSVPGAQAVLDGADPGRDCFEHPVMDSLSAADERAWGGAVERAWATVRGHAPHLSRGMAAFIRTVTPIRPRPGRPARATSTRGAFGAVGLSLGTPRVLGALLVGQTARLALAALQDVCDLADPVGRADPAALAALAARVAVWDLAAATARAEPAPSVAAERNQLLVALDGLERAGDWSEPGSLALAGLRDRVESRRFDGP